MTVTDKLIHLTGNEKETLTFIRDYMESRLVLLKSIPVSLSHTADQHISSLLCMSFAKRSIGLT